MAYHGHFQPTSAIMEGKMRRFAAYILAVMILTSINLCGLYCSLAMDSGKKVSVSAQMPSCHMAKKSAARAVAAGKSRDSLKTPVPCLEKNVVAGIFAAQNAFKPIVIITDRIQEFSFLLAVHSRVAHIDFFTPHLYSKLPLYLSKNVIRV